MRNWRVINNTFETPASGGGTPAPGTIWANNLGDWACYPGAVFTGNVGKTCAPPTEPLAALRLARPRQPRLPPHPHVSRHRRRQPHLRPATDKDGNPRNGPPDAGAYEYRP